jgi:hypothetical protein
MIAFRTFAFFQSGHESQSAGLLQVCAFSGSLAKCFKTLDDTSSYSREPSPHQSGLPAPLGALYKPPISSNISPPSHSPWKEPSLPSPSFSRCREMGVEGSRAGEGAVGDAHKDGISPTHFRISCQGLDSHCCVILPIGHCFCKTAPPKFPPPALPLLPQPLSIAACDYKGFWIAPDPSMLVPHAHIATSAAFSPTSWSGRTANSHSPPSSLPHPCHHRAQVPGRTCRLSRQCSSGRTAISWPRREVQERNDE